jgi:hydroxymethylbilane synthase
MTSPFRIGTRGSRLALWQATYVADRLRPFAGERGIELVEIETAGDQVRDVPLSAFGGEGAFTKEIQRALLEERVDVAVHSLKDLPTIPVEGLMLAAVPPRGATADVFISTRHPYFDALPSGATVATSSMRRRAQLLHRRPDLNVENIRGNVETRLRKLAEQGLEALILAQAGLQRLGLEHVVTEVLDAGWMLPAVGQGALGLECRTADTATRALAGAIDDPAARQATCAERSLLRALGGGCQVPLGASATVRDGQLYLRAAVLDAAGLNRIADQLTGHADDAETLGCLLADRLLAQGARDLLEQST